MPTVATATETHISTLFFTADRVYKLLKPIDNGFLDHTATSARLAAAERELVLNRRMAPDVYLGLADVVEFGETVDRMIVMRRMPADRALSELIRADAPDWFDHVRSVAKAVAAFHASLPPIPAADGPGSLTVQRRNWEDSFATMDSFVGPVLDAEADARIRTLVRAYLDGHETLFAERIEAGLIRDGHGDLLAEDIFCLDDGPRILDCLAFRDDFRIGDVLSDAAFLAMDLHRLAGPSVAQAFMRWYCEFSNEHHPGSLGHHYVAYRAHIRCKVACLRWQQGAPEFAAVARMYHLLALDQLERGQARIVLVGGGPATGKTTVAGRIGDHFGWPVLDTDSIRKDLAGVDRQTHAFAQPDEGIYVASATAATYDELLREAGVLLRQGESVVLDASFTQADHRVAARAVADRYHAEVTEIECQLEPAIAKERLARRLADGWNPSDATPEVIDHLLARRDTWPQATVLQTERGLDDVCAEAVAAISPNRPPHAHPDGNTGASRFWMGWAAAEATHTFGRPVSANRPTQAASTGGPAEVQSLPSTREPRPA